jgi:hypothetical protein
MSGAQHCRTILLCIATWTGVKLCKKIVHGGLSLTWPWDFVPHILGAAVTASLILVRKPIKNIMSAFDRFPTLTIAGQRVRQGLPTFATNVHKKIGRPCDLV